MSKIKITEVFHSLQGEGLWVGVPSVFVRTFGCNFRCKGFGLPDGELTAEPEEVAEQLKVNPSWTFHDLPLVSTGCDSYGAVYPAFKSLSPMMEVDKLVDEMELTRRADSGMARNDGGTHLVITGGEPLLGWQRAYPEFLEKARDKGYKQVTFETNGTQAIQPAFADYLLKQQITGNTHRITFSVSPKIYSSGEDIENTLKPEIVADYMKYGTVYLKFVVADPSDMADVVQFVSEYKAAGWDGEVYLMPCGGDPDLYNLNAPEVAKFAMAYGYRYSPRLQVDLWKNEWGT